MASHRRNAVGIKRAAGFLALLGLWLLPGTGAESAPPPAAGAALILSDPADPYYALAQEISRAEDLAIVSTLDEALAARPTFLLWVVSPGGLSERVMIDFGLAMRDQPSAISSGILSGATLNDARALWQRALSARADPAYAVNAANPAGNIEAGITLVEGTPTDRQSLTKENLIGTLRHAGYLTFTGHGGSSYLRLYGDTMLRSADLPALPPLVVATGSCNTFQPWEEDSIALAFARQGAAAYAGYAFSPNEGYLMGEFDGLPFRYTWPGFPVGHVVQAQNRGTMQGFAGLPFYHLLGDPRLALQTEAPYRLAGVETVDGGEVRTYTGAPEGVIPVRVPGGARYAFVEVPGVGMAWRGEPFYNARLQMIDIGEDKFVLLEHPGGDFRLHLRSRAPWPRVASDVILDSLDGTLLFLQDHGGAPIMSGAGLLTLVLVAVLLLRRRASPRALLPAALTGLAFAAAHGLYALARLERLSVSSKDVQFSLLAPAATFLLVGCGAFLYLRARSRRGRAVALAVACLGALAPAVALLALLGVVGALLMKADVGVSLWNNRLAWQPLLVSALGAVVLAPAFHVLRRFQR